MVWLTRRPRGIAPRPEQARECEVALLSLFGSTLQKRWPTYAGPGIFLVRHRRMPSVRHYLRCARMFLTWLPGSLERSLPRLSAGQVVDFMRDWTTRRRSPTLDMVTLPALRSLLRFLHMAGPLRWALGGAVPSAPTCPPPANTASTRSTPSPNSTTDSAGYQESPEQLHHRTL